MARWLDKLIGREKKPPVAPLPPPERAKWLTADEPGNPFGVPLLNLMMLQQYISTTEVLAYAERAVSWTSSTGRELSSSSERLASLPPLECALRYPAASSLPDGILYAPPSQDFKWVLALRDSRVLAARSWTGVVEAVADARRDGADLVLERLRVAEDSCLRLSSRLVDVFDWLLRVHVWDQRLPLPVDDQAAELLERVPLSGFGAFGKALFCAAKSWAPPPPPRPLRADGEVIVAARKGDTSSLKRAIEHGADIDAPSPFQGRTALHLAVMRGDVALFDELVRLGANPANLADRGNHALGIAVVHDAPLPMLERLAETHLDLSLANADGFTALHAAAEVDNGAVIPWLVAHHLPLEARTKHGHTALHIACALGHAEAAKALLTAGSDIMATSPGGTARDLAHSENKPTLVALLDEWRSTHFARDN